MASVHKKGASGGQTNFEDIRNSRSSIDNGLFVDAVDCQEVLLTLASMLI